MAINLNATQSGAWLVESPLVSVAGETTTYSVTYLGSSSVSSVTGTVYQNKSDVTSTIMPSGSTSASGNVATLKPITAMTGGKKYVITVTATVDGNVVVKKFMIRCQKATLEQ